VLLHCSSVRSRSHTILHVFPQLTVEQSTVTLFWSVTVEPFGSQLWQHVVRRHTSSQPAVAMVPGGMAHTVLDVMGMKFGGAIQSLGRPSNTRAGDMKRLRVARTSAKIGYSIFNAFGSIESPA